MKNEIAEQALFNHLSLFNILEAFLAGTTDSFLVLDQEGKVVMFNDHFAEFAQYATSQSLQAQSAFIPYIGGVDGMQVLSDAITAAYADGATNKFSFSIVCNQKRWYDAEIHPLKTNDRVIGLGVGIFETTARREAEEAVKRSEALFKALVQNSSDIFILSDRYFRLGYVSDAIKTILGYDPTHLAGTNGFNLVHTDDKESFAAWIAQLIDKPAVALPIEFRAKNNIGGWRYMEARGQNMLQDKQVASIVLHCRDIHASKVADQALLQAEQRLTLLLNNTKESFILLNDRLRIIAYNRAAQEHAPYFLDSELRSDVSFGDLLRPSEKEEYLPMFEEVLRGAERETMTHFRDAAGNEHIFQHTFRSLNLQDAKGIFITSTDITEKRQAELALKEKEERFRMLIEYSFDAILVVDAEANIQYASPSIYNLLGYESHEVTGRNGFEFIWHEDIPMVQTKLLSILQNVDETYADYRSTTKHGGLKWIEAKGKNMFHNPYINGILVSLRDISDRKKLEEEQSALTGELVKYNKDLQQFSFITSHNLRAPVANLMSLLSLYNHDDTGDPFNAELMPKFRECADQLNDTLNDLINVLVIRSKAGADIEFVRFQDMVDLVLKNVGALLHEAKGIVDTDFSQVDGIPYNKVHLESIFLNLLTNAIKYSDPGRPLQVNIRSEDVDGWVKLHFSDNGIGIDLDRYSDRIFGLYQRFNASKEGKGLGLYMIKSQVSASGGKIEVQSKPGQGTSFILHFRKRG